MIELEPSYIELLALSKAKVIALEAKVAELEQKIARLNSLPFPEQLGDEKLQVEIARLNSLEFPDVHANNFGSHTTQPAESVAGIALRQLGDEKLWVEIARLNSLEFPDVHANDYYPVGTVLILPGNNPPKALTS
jgi:hypothetical protein